MRGRTSSLLAVALVAPMLIASGGPPSEPCLTDIEVDPAHGDHRDWTSEPAEAWRVRQEPTSRWVTVDAPADAPSTARLATDTILATTTTRLELQHDRMLAPGDGYVVEVAVDGGNWTDAGDLLLDGGYDGTTSDGTPAFTGPMLMPVVFEEAGAAPVVSEVDLSAFAGREVRVSLRLAVTTGAPGAFVSFHLARWDDVRDPDCLDGYAANPWAACLEDRVLSVAPDPDGDVGSTPGWRPGVAFVPWITVATGLDAKDDRLVSEAFRATPRTRVSFTQRFELEPGHDGGRLEYTTDGATWTPVPEAWVLVGAYTGRLADGEPAWTGASATHPENVRPNGEWDIMSAVDLGPLAGEQVRLRHRLLQDARRPDSTPGVEWSTDRPQVHDVARTGCTVPPRHIVDVEPEDCLDERPDHVEPPLVTDDGRHQLDVLVLLEVAEGAQLAALRDDAARQSEWQQRWEALVEEMEALLLPAATGYDRHDVALTLTYRLLDPYWESGDARPEELTSQEALQVAKDAVGGVRPDGYDVVYLATDRDGFEGAVAGRADCIGGVRYDDAAFAVGATYRGRDDLGAAGTRWIEDVGAMVLAHEVGHLLGAHHHYANCVEPTQDVVDSPVLFARCTTMINDVGLASLRFSTLSGSVVRGYAASHGDH